MKIQFNNLYIHYIMVTKNRYPFIKEEKRERIEKYISGIVSNHRSHLYAIFANPEHVHMLISRSPLLSDQELLTRISESSKKFILDNNVCENQFAWQETAFAFSVSKSDIDRVCKYILNQKTHHQKTTFALEYEKLMKFYQQTLRWEIAA